MYNQSHEDAEQVRLLVILHYVLAGLSVPVLFSLGLHYAFMRFFFLRPEAVLPPPGPSPGTIFVLLHALYAVIAILIIGIGAINFLSARFLAQRRHRLYSLIVAGLDCLQFPFGTALGVFTLLVLLRPSVEETYRSRLDRDFSGTLPTPPRWPPEPFGAPRQISPLCS